MYNINLFKTKSAQRLSTLLVLLPSNTMSLPIEARTSRYTLVCVAINLLTGMVALSDRMKKTEVDLVIFKIGSRGHRICIRIRILHWFRNRTAILSPARTGTWAGKSIDAQPHVSLLFCLVTLILIQLSSRL